MKEEDTVKQIRKTQIAKALVGYAVLVVAVVGLRTTHVNGIGVRVIARPGSAAENYENRIHTTNVMLESGRLETSGN